MPDSMQCESSSISKFISAMGNRVRVHAVRVSLEMTSAYGVATGPVVKVGPNSPIFNIATDLKSGCKSSTSNVLHRLALMIALKTQTNKSVTISSYNKLYSIVVKKVTTIFGATGAQGGGVASTFLDDPVARDEWTIRAITRDTYKSPAMTPLVNQVY